MSIQPKYLVSACLLGVSCRYDGSSRPSKEVIEFAKTHATIPVCPELLGGLGVTRKQVEIVGGRAIARSGEDLTPAFQKGAETTLSLYHTNLCTGVILKSKSPSCGYRCIYDGTFTGKLIDGNGITASLLRLYNVPIYVDKPPDDEPPY